MIPPPTYCDQIRPYTLACAFEVLTKFVNLLIQIYHFSCLPWPGKFFSLAVVSLVNLTHRRLQHFHGPASWELEEVTTRFGIQGFLKLFVSYVPEKHHPVFCFLAYFYPHKAFIFEGFYLILKKFLLSLKIPKNIKTWIFLIWLTSMISPQNFSAR